MTQRNLGSGKERKIRAPHKWKSPELPIAAKGKTEFEKVPPGSAGKVVYVKPPEHKGQKFPVAVPASAGTGGGAMLVTVPEKDTKRIGAPARRLRQVALQGLVRPALLSAV